MNLVSTLLFLCFALGSFSFDLFAFTPGKWSYTDQFLFSKGKTGPSQEIVKNSEGKVIYTATYSYNAEGKLISESYENSSGEADGTRTFEYKNGLLASEKGYDAEGNLFERKDFIYKGTSLKKILVYDGENKPLIHYYIDMNRDGVILGSEGKNFITGDVESFRMEINKSTPEIQIQVLNDDKKKKIGEIVLRFDSQKRLIEREFTQGEVQRLNKMEYDGSGQLMSYTFHVKQAQGWALEKVHTLIYGTSKNSSKKS